MKTFSINFKEHYNGNYCAFLIWVELIKIFESQSAKGNSYDNLFYDLKILQDTINKDHDFSIFWECDRSYTYFEECEDISDEEAYLEENTFSVKIEVDGEDCYFTVSESLYERLNGK